MAKLDWRKAKPIVSLGATAEIGDQAASEDCAVIAENARKRRKALNKLKSNWLKTPEEVAAYQATQTRKQRDA